MAKSKRRNRKKPQATRALRIKRRKSDGRGVRNIRFQLSHIQFMASPAHHERYKKLVWLGAAPALRSAVHSCCRNLRFNGAAPQSLISKKALGAGGMRIAVLLSESSIVKSKRAWNAIAKRNFRVISPVLARALELFRQWELQPHH